MGSRRQPKLIGPAVRDYRMRLGLTQEAVAELADVAPATLSRVERNRLATSLDLARRLAVALEVSVDELLSAKRSITESSSSPSTRPAERRLLALVRRLDEAQIDDITRAVKLVLAVGASSTRRRRAKESRA